MAIADLVKSTLGPKGMDKILQSVGRGRGVTVTNDGATILRSIYVDNPAAKVLVDISRVQDEEVGDGTTSVVVLAGELLREAEKLVRVFCVLFFVSSGVFYCSFLRAVWGDGIRKKTQKKKTQKKNSKKSRKLSDRRQDPPHDHHRRLPRRRRRAQ